MDDDISVQNDALLELNDVKTQVSNNREEQKQNKPFREKIKDPEYRMKVFHSCALGIAFMSLGFQVGQRGPSFLDVQLITNTDVETASTFFTAGSVGYLTGSLVYGILIDKYNKIVLLMISIIFLAATVSVIPLCSLYILMLLMFFFNSVFAGALDTGGNTTQVAVWGEKEGQSFMQFIHFAFSLGGVISPLITAPFLTPLPEKDPSANMTTIAAENTTHFPIINASQLISTASIDQNQTTINNNVEEIRLIYAYLISGVVTLLSLIPFCFIFCKLKSKKDRPVKKRQEVPEQTRDLPWVYYITTIIFIDLMYLFYCAVEDTFAAYLLTFVVLHLKWSKAQGSQISSIFWASFAISRFSGIFFIGCIRPVRMLCICLIALMINLFGFLLCAYFYVMPGIWVFTILIGFSLSVVFPTGFTWTQESILKVTGKVSASILIAASTGTMINPIIMGYLMEEVDTMWYCYLLVGQSVICFCIFVILYFISNYVLVKVRIPDPQTTNVNAE